MIIFIVINTNSSKIIWQEAAAIAKGPRDALRQLNFVIAALYFRFYMDEITSMFTHNGPYGMRHFEY